MENIKDKLEELGFRELAPKIRPNQYELPIIGKIVLKEGTTIDDIFLMCYKKGHIDGVKTGKKIKIAQIKEVLEK